MVNIVVCLARVGIPYGVVAILIWYLKPTGHKFLDLKNVWTETFFLVLKKYFLKIKLQ